MEFKICCDAKFYFQISEEIRSDYQQSRFSSLRGRLVCFEVLIERLLALPFTLFFKAYKTVFRVAGVFVGASAVLLTLGVSQIARDFFMRRVSNLSKDLADWILLPLALITCFLRLSLALIHPGIVLG